MVHADEVRKRFSARLRRATANEGWPERGAGARLAKLAGATPKAASKWLNGEAMPRQEKLGVIAKALRVSQQWLQYGEGSMVAGVAEELEPWGDDVAPGPANHGSIPIISYVQAGEFCEAEDPFEPGMADEWLPFRPPGAGPRTYALRVDGESNFPRIRSGEIVIVDPDRAPDSGKFVVAKRHSDAKVTLKMIQFNEGEPFLKPGNPDWPEPIIKIDGGWSICGVVIGKYDPM